MRVAVVLLAAAVGLCALQLAQAQACPSTVCNSAFSNAVGGPIDCCKFKYSGTGGKCQWGGTPVSFTLAGTCSSGGQTYQTLIASNAQGPPGQPNCRCKDPSAPAPAACPTTICNSYFANAMGGPIDCCKFSYSGPGGKCQWGGTPVSFTLMGTCSAGGQTYQTLSASNSQGPPGQPNCRCKDAGGSAPTPAPTPAPATVSGFVARTNTDVPGKDLPSDGKSFTQVCGPPSAVAQRCAQGHKGGTCVGFVYDEKTKCGFIKYSTDGATNRGGFTLYVVAPPAAVSGYVARAGYDIPGKDLASDGQSYTKVCGPPSAVAARCAQGHKGGTCVGFVYDAKAQCGFIKFSVDGPVVRQGYVVYVKADKVPKSGALALPAAGR